MNRITRTNRSNYPNKLDSDYNYPKFIDGTTTIIASRINDLKDAITAIELAIGINPISEEYSDIEEFLSEISDQNFVQQIGDTVTGDIEFHSFGNNISSRLFFGNNCNASITIDEFSYFPGSKNGVDIGTKWVPSKYENISNADGVVPLSIIGTSIFGVTSAGSMRNNSGHKIRIFNDVESRGGLFVGETIYTPIISNSPIEEINLLDDSQVSFYFSDVESHGAIKSDDRLEFIGSEFSRSLEDDGPPTVIVPANSGYEILLILFSAYLPFKQNRSDADCDGLKLRLNEDRINLPSLYAPYDEDKPNSLNNVSLMNFMVIPSTNVTENSTGEFIVKFDPSIENKISLVRDGYTSYSDYPTLMHMVTVFGQRSGCFDIINNDEAPVSFDLTVDGSGTYVDFDGTKYTVS